MCDYSSRTNDVMSSANVTNFISFRTLFRIESYNNSRTMIKGKSLLLLMLSCTTIFATIEGIIGGGS